MRLALSRFVHLTRVTLLAAACGLLVGCGSSSEGLDASKLPEDVQGDYALFANRCSKCHGLARPLSAGITDDQQWVMYVNRMRRQPGSGITMSDQEHILRFLRYYAAELRRKKAGAPAASSAPLPSAAPSPPSSAPPPPPSPSVAPAGGGS